MKTETFEQPSNGRSKAKPTRREWSPPKWQLPHAEQVCRDCGALGCLVPVPHGPRKDV